MEKEEFENWVEKKYQDYIKRNEEKWKKEIEEYSYDMYREYAEQNADILTNGHPEDYELDEEQIKYWVELDVKIDYEDFLDYLRYKFYNDINDEFSYIWEHPQEIDVEDEVAIDNWIFNYEIRIKMFSAGECYKEFGRHWHDRNTYTIYYCIDIEDEHFYKKKENIA